MKTYDYLIIGGGMTAAAAVEGIRETGQEGSIGMFSMEKDAPYNRPPLTKDLWKGKSVDSIWRKMEGRKPEMHLGTGIKRVVPEEKRVETEDGEAYGYHKLLLATGGEPRLLPFKDDGIIYYRTLGDYRRLREATGHGRHFAVIGNGFIGSEIAAALAMNDKKVVMIFPGKSIAERAFPPSLSEYVTRYYEKKGVEIMAGDEVSACEPREGQHALTTKSGRELVVDGVVVGIGIEPNVKLAKEAGLEVDNGIVVDQFLRTSTPEIFAAGDVACFHNPALGKRIRVEHEDNANSMGKAAGRNMAGKMEAYDHLPFFYSDLFDLGYEAVGELDARLEIFADWKRENEEGVVYYLKDSRVRGVLLWNVWDQVPAARELIADPGPFTKENLKGRLPAPKKKE